MERKIIFFDIDGTIITEDTHEIPNSTIDAIRKARENGHLAFVNTGRTYESITKNIREIGFDGYICGCGTYIRIGEQVVLSSTVSMQMAKKVIALICKYHIGAILEATEDVYFDLEENFCERERQIKEEYRRRGMGQEKTWRLEDLTFDKFYTVPRADSNTAAFRAEIEAEFDYIDRGHGEGEIVPKGYSKASGILFLLQHYGMEKEDAYVIGDSANDLPMFECVTHRIAMGNSVPELLEKASFVTRDIKEDGVAYALKKYRMIE